MPLPIRRALGATLFVASAACGGLLGPEGSPGGPMSDASSLEASDDSSVMTADGDDGTSARDSSVEASPIRDASGHDATDAAKSNDASHAIDAADALADTSTDATQTHTFCNDACAVGDQVCDWLPQVCTYDDAGHTIGCVSQGLGVWTCAMGTDGCTVWANGVACAADIPCCDSCQQGVCPLGPVGDPCQQDTDCASDACDAIAHVCVSSQCNDHRQDGNESDVDCGGPVCDACMGGQRCRTGLDCWAGSACLGGTVRRCNGVPPPDASTSDAGPCTDECKLGAQECSQLPQVCTYDDAGFTASCSDPGEGFWSCVVGSAGCAVWQRGARCGSSCCAGCQQVACAAGATPPCWSCPPGADGSPCDQDPDCTSNACDALGHACIANLCADHRQDGQETDVDCGGPACGPCGVGRGCQTSVDCQPAHICVNNGYGKWCE